MDSEEALTLVSDRQCLAADRPRDKFLLVEFFILRSRFNSQNGTQQTKKVDDERRTNHKKRTNDCFLLFCETVLNHERDWLQSEVNFYFFAFLFIFVFTEIFVCSCIAIAINRHSTHPRNWHTRFGCLSRRPARTQLSTQTLTVEQMEKFLLTQMVSDDVEKKIQNRDLKCLWSAFSKTKCLLSCLRRRRRRWWGRGKRQLQLSDVLLWQAIRWTADDRVFWLPHLASHVLREGEAQEYSRVLLLRGLQGQRESVIPFERQPHGHLNSLVSWRRVRQYTKPK